MPYLAALLSGLLASICFPTIVEGVRFPNLSWLAWVALVPYILVLRKSPLWRVALLTFLFSFLWNGLTSYWIFIALYFNGKISFGLSLGILTFMATGMGAMHAVFVAVALWLGRRGRIPFILILPAAWTLYEWARNFWPFSGYPWSNLGYTQAPWLTLIQSADLFGLYGVTFLIVIVNVLVADVVVALRKKNPVPRRSLAAVALLCLCFIVYGALRFNQVSGSLQDAQHMRVGLVQPNITQALKWKKNVRGRIVNRLLKLTAEAEDDGAEFIVWPEASYPTPLPLHLRELEAFSSFRVPVTLGVLSTLPKPGRKQPILYNSALQVRPGGDFFGRQHKQHLVPLGEYVPLPELLWFLQTIVPTVGDFRTEPVEVLLQVQDQPYGVAVCYEDLFPEVPRDFTRLGASFLINISNDGWYGDSSQLDQHLNFSRFRAVENRRSMLRSTNTGLTVAIDSTGRVIAELPKFIDGVLMVDIPLGGPMTLYTRFGDSLWILLLGIALATPFLYRMWGTRFFSRTD